MKLQEKYDIDRINHLKSNKSEITSEILEELRSFGDDGKQFALDILRLSVEEKYSEIHYIEMQKCKKDILYFRNNYVKLKKLSGGTFFAWSDDVQNKIISLISNNKRLIIDSDRQTKKSTAAQIVILHKFLFDNNQNIGIVSKNASQSKYNIFKIEEMYTELPEFFKIPGTKLNKTSIYNKEKKNRIFIDNIDGDSFRSIKMNFILVDCSLGVTESKMDKFLESIIPLTNSIEDSKLVILEKVLTEYMNSFVQWNELSNECPIKTEQPILKRTFKQIIKDFIRDLYNKIKRIINV